MNILGLPLSVTLGILLLLLLLSAFFSGSETALTRARRVRLRALKEGGVRGAKSAEKLLEEPEHMLSTILLGNNFVNIAASSLAAALLLRAFGEAGIFYATLIMTLVVLIFSEVLPKTIAVVHAEAISCAVAPLLRGIQWLLRPIVALLMAIISFFKWMLRVPHKSDTPLTHQELATMIDISAEYGMLDEAREQMLISSLSLHKVAVKSLMKPRKNMRMLDGSQTVEQCLKQAMAHPYSRYPVYLHEPDHIVGIVHLRDMMKVVNRHTPLADAIIWQQPPYIPTTKNALSQLFDFQARHQHMAIVVDEFGDIEGLITLEDIIEDIVGEIHDESDMPARSEMWLQPDESLVTSGTVSLRDINQKMDWQLPEDIANTIGGLLVHTLGEQPEERLCITINGIHIEILSISGDWIQRVRLFAEPEVL